MTSMTRWSHEAHGQEINILVLIIANFMYMPNVNELLSLTYYYWEQI